MQRSSFASLILVVAVLATGVVLVRTAFVSIKLDTRVGRTASPSLGAMPIRSLVGYNVRSSDGDVIGTVADIVMDVEDEGQIRYVILSLDNAFVSGKVRMAGVRNPLVPIPWSHVIVDANAQTLVLDVKAETVNDAPWFHSWPNTSASRWADVKAFWSDR